MRLDGTEPRETPGPTLRDVQDRLDRMVSAHDSLTVRGAEAAGVAGDTRLDAAQRVGIYAEMFRLRMHDALAEDFPAVRVAVGGDRFAELCAAYVATYPSRSASLAELGHALADFLAAPTSSPAVAGTPPWLAALARLEWALVVAFTAPGGPCLTRADLHALAPDQWPALELRPVGSWLRCDAEHDVEAVRERLLAGDPVAADQPRQAVSLRIWRKQHRVFLRRLTPLETAALSRFGKGCRFAALAEWLVDHVPPDRASEEALALLLRWVDDEFLLQPAMPPTA